MLQCYCRLSIYTPLKSTAQTTYFYELTEGVKTDFIWAEGVIVILTTQTVKLYDTAITLCTLGCVDFLSVCRAAKVAVEVSIGI